MNYELSFFHCYYHDSHVSLLFFLVSLRMMQIKDNERLRKRFGQGIPDLRDLADSTSLIFVNQHFSFAGPRPLSVNVVEIGGIHIKQSRKSLPDDLQDLLDNAKNGVIYVSWGSIINSKGMSLSKKQEIVEAFKLLPQTILWKWENDSLTATAKNVHIRSWMPQIDILCHPNVKAFMSHGGLMGTSEGVYCEKPTIVTPIYGDQYLNAAALVHRGMGIVLHYNQLTRDSIVDAVQRILQPRFVKVTNAVE
jgi:glucuronosyltransferase